VFAAYKSGVDALRSIQRPQSLEQAQDLLDDLKEMTEEGEDISAALSEGRDKKKKKKKKRQIMRACTFYSPSLYFSLLLDLTGDADEDELMRELEDIVAATGGTREKLCAKFTELLRPCCGCQLFWII